MSTKCPTPETLARTVRNGCILPFITVAAVVATMALRDSGTPTAILYTGLFGLASMILYPFAVLITLMLAWARYPTPSIAMGFAAGLSIGAHWFLAPSHSALLTTGAIMAVAAAIGFVMVHRSDDDNGGGGGLRDDGESAPPLSNALVRP